MRADLLADPVDGLDEALAAVDAFDRALAGGLLRPHPAQAAGLAQLAAAVAGTPLASRVAQAAEAAAAGSADEGQLLALAAARAALLGAAHDALAARVAEVTGRAAAPEPAVIELRDDSGGAANLLAAARAWLCDLVRAGWQGLTDDVVAGAAPAVSAMLPDPALRRLAMLADGFAAELAACCPGAVMPRFPVRRWADLWSRGMLLTVPGAAAVQSAGTVTGRLLPLGVDLQEHATAAQAQVHAVLEPADRSGPRLVRASVSVPKPDTVTGAGVWQLLRPHLSLLAAAGEGRAMELTDMQVTAEGDLIWCEDQAAACGPADPFATARVALGAAACSAPAPAARHPAGLAVPVFADGYAVSREDDGGLALVFAAGRLLADTGRIPAAGPLSAQMVAASSACIGLLRWDAGAFRLQPLAVEATVKKKATAVHAGAWAGGTADKLGVKAEKAAAEATEALRERAGRLLRK